MSRVTAAPILVMGLSLAVLAGCQTTSQPAAGTGTSGASSSMAVAGGEPSAQSQIETEPRPKPEHEKPLAQMTCPELHDAVVGYRTAMLLTSAHPEGLSAEELVAAHPPPPPTMTSGGALAVGLAGGLFGLAGAAAALENMRVTYEDNGILYDEALPVYNARGCAAEVARIRAEQAAQWQRMAKWSGSVEVDDDIGAGNAASQSCNAIDVSFVIGIEGDLVLGRLTLPRGSIPGMPNETDVPMRGKFTVFNSRFEIETEALPDAYRFTGNLHGGRWSAGQCTGAFRLEPKPA